MGVSTVIAHFLLFIITVTLVMMIVDTVTGYVTNMNSSLKQKVDVISEKIKTDITIITINYDSLTNVLTVYVENTGSVTLDPDDMDLYIDNERIARSDVNRTVEEDTDTVNPGLLDNSEILNMNTTKALSSGEHSVLVSTHNGIVARKVFSI